MNTRLTLIALLLCVPLLAAVAGPVHTPAPGSPERQAICDGARAHVIAHYTTNAKLPQPIVFKVEKLRSDGDYCYFEGLPLFKDGTPVGTDYIADIVFELCLKRSGDRWRVIYDLSRTDVPDDTELKQIWRAFPKDFPFQLIPKFWQDLLNRVNH